MFLIESIRLHYGFTWARRFFYLFFLYKQNWKKNKGFKILSRLLYGDYPWIIVRYYLSIFFDAINRSRNVIRFPTNPQHIAPVWLTNVSVLCCNYIHKYLGIHFLSILKKKGVRIGITYLFYSFFNFLILYN